jgi:SOS-response transcriptional repressor LexA
VSGAALRSVPRSSRPRCSPITQRQRVVLDWIKAHISQYAQAPTQTEIAEGLGITQGSAWEYLKGLERCGVIRRPHKGAHRGIDVVGLGEDELPDTSA